MPKHYELIVIGSGPAGEKAAVKAAYFGHSVALIEAERNLGGAGVNTGTLPSKTLKETALFFSGKRDKGVFGVDRILQHNARLEDFMYRKNYVVSFESKEVYENVVRHNVSLYQGFASFDDPHTISIKKSNGSVEQLTADYFIIATGSYPVHPKEIPFDNKRVHDSDTILNIERMPSSICIVGAGVIGCEYVTIFANMGCKVYLVNRSDSILPFIDKECRDELVNCMTRDQVEIFFNDGIKEMKVPSEPFPPIQIELNTGKKIEVDMFLFAAGRNGHTKELQCEKIGIKMGSREQLLVDAQYRTNIPNIFAVGDVIGFPALASTSMDQGRVAVSHIFNTGDLDSLAKVIPYGIYTIPEVSLVGITEEEAIKQKLDYCVGRARYTDMARGRIMGLQEGFLKLVFDKESGTVLGVHIAGALATELIHYGMEIVTNKKTVNHIVSTVFNYPTLHDLYKYAAYDGLGNRSGHKIREV